MDRASLRRLYYYYIVKFGSVTGVLESAWLFRPLYHSSLRAAIRHSITHFLMLFFDPSLLLKHDLVLKPTFEQEDQTFNQTSLA